MINALKRGDMVAQPGCFRLRWMGEMWLTQYRLQLEDFKGGWHDATHDYFLDIKHLTDGGFEYVGNDLRQMELF